MAFNVVYGSDQIAADALAGGMAAQQNRQNEMVYRYGMEQQRQQQANARALLAANTRAATLQAQDMMQQRDMVHDVGMEGMRQENRLEAIQQAKLEEFRNNFAKRNGELKDMGFTFNEQDAEKVKKLEAAIANAGTKPGVPDAARPALVTKALRELEMMRPTEAPQQPETYTAEDGTTYLRNPSTGEWGPDTAQEKRLEREKDATKLKQDAAKAKAELKVKLMSVKKTEVVDGIPTDVYPYADMEAAKKAADELIVSPEPDVGEWATGTPPVDPTANPNAPGTMPSDAMAQAGAPQGPIDSFGQPMDLEMVGAGPGVIGAEQGAEAGSHQDPAIRSQQIADSASNPDGLKWLAGQELTRDDIKTIESLPKTGIREIDETRFLLAHPELAGSDYMPTTQEKVNTARMAAYDTKLPSRDFENHAEYMQASAEQDYAYADKLLKLVGDKGISEEESDQLRTEASKAREAGRQKKVEALKHQYSQGVMRRKEEERQAEIKGEVDQLGADWEAEARRQQGLGPKQDLTLADGYQKKLQNEEQMKRNEQFVAKSRRANIERAQKRIQDEHGVDVTLSDDDIAFYGGLSQEDRTRYREVAASLGKAPTQDEFEENKLKGDTDFLFGDEGSASEEEVVAFNRELAGKRNLMQERPVEQGERIPQSEEFDPMDVGEGDAYQERVDDYNEQVTPDVSGVSPAEYADDAVTRLRAAAGGIDIGGGFTGNALADGIIGESQESPEKAKVYNDRLRAIAEKGYSGKPVEDMTNNEVADFVYNTVVPSLYGKDMDATKLGIHWGGDGNDVQRDYAKTYIELAKNKPTSPGREYADQLRRPASKEMKKYGFTDSDSRAYDYLVGSGAISKGGEWWLDTKKNEKTNTIMDRTNSVVRQYEVALEEGEGFDDVIVMKPGAYGAYDALPPEAKERVGWPEYAKLLGLPENIILFENKYAKKKFDKWLKKFKGEKGYFYRTGHSSAGTYEDFKDAD